MQIALKNFSQTSFATELQRMADEFSITFIPEGESNAPVLCVCDSYLASSLVTWNRQALAENIPWIAVWANWTRPWIGPFFRYDELCHACMAKRIRDNLQVDNFINTFHKNHIPFALPRAKISSLLQAAPSFILSQLSQLSENDLALLSNNIVQFDFVMNEASVHRVSKRPQCPVCGPEEPAQRTEINLQDNLYQYTYGGERRSCLPSETWEKYKHHISPIAGIASSFVSKSPPDQEHLHSYATGHAFPVRPGDLAALKGNLRHRSGGKGATDIQARVGALCEAIERYSGLNTGEEEFVTSSYNALHDTDAIHIDEITLFSDAQFKTREQWNRTCVVNFQLVPNQLDNDAAIDWCKLWSLTTGSTKMVPAAYCYYGHKDLAHFFCSCDSNGCAAGNTIEEAILRGFMELVERDAVAIWWYNRTRQPMVDIDSFDDPYIEFFKNKIAQSDRSLWAIDLTTDLGIPAIAAISHRTNHPTEDIIIGFSADLDPKTALLRAINEVGQFLPALSHNDKDGNTLYYYEDKCAIYWWKSATLKEHQYLLPDEGRTLTGKDFNDVKSKNQKTEVEFCVNRAAACNLDMLVLNQTRPDIRLPVAKVIVPGMRHFWNRLAPGRLYDVPLKLGRLDKRTAEHELNPIPMFF